MKRLFIVLLLVLAACSSVDSSQLTSEKQETSVKYFDHICGLADSEQEWCDKVGRNQSACDKEILDEVMITFDINESDAAKTIAKCSQRQNNQTPA